MITRLSDGFIVRCDHEGCNTMMTFEYEKSYPGLFTRMKEVGWHAFKRGERWINYCPKCAPPPVEEKDQGEELFISLDNEEREIIRKAKEHYEEMDINLNLRDTLKRIITDFGEMLVLVELEKRMFKKDGEDKTGQ